MRIKSFKIFNYKLDVVDAHTFFTRLAGLMGKKELKVNEGMLLRPCSSIHTCFMKFAIDVVFLDGEYRVVELINNMSPWRFSSHNKSAKQVLELRAGTVDRFGIKKGTILEVSE